MINSRFFQKPEYCEYVRLLSRLHGLISTGTDENAAGDKLRDQMDVCSEEFTDDEIDSLHGISSDLYSLSEATGPRQPQSEKAQKVLTPAIQANRSGDYIAALDYLRRIKTMIDPAVLSYMRGRILSDSGVTDVAYKFFKHASEIDPNNDNYAYVVLDSLKLSDFSKSQTQSDEILAAVDRYPTKLLLKAAEIRFSSMRSAAPEKSQTIAAELIPVFEKVIAAFESATLDTPRFLPMAYALCGFCYQELDDQPAARNCFDQAIRLDSKNDALFTARGILLYSDDTKSAMADFSKAIDLEPSTAWPFMFMAHQYLIHERYVACLQMCEDSLRYPLTDKLRANCFEWIAICHATLDTASETVRSYFDRAIALAPENERIARNRQAFEDCAASQVDKTVVWDLCDERKLRETGRAEFEFRAAA